MGKRWTEEEVGKAKHMANNGKTHQEIADVLGRKQNAVSIKLSSIGYKKEYPYLYSVGEVVNVTLRIIKQIKIKEGKHTRKGYIVKSLAYPSDKNDYEITEGNLKQGVGCAYLSGNRVCEESSLWSNESIRPHIIDVEEAKKTSRSSGKPILFQCGYEDCDHTKEMRSADLYRKGFSCNVCSKNLSYGNLAFGCYQVHNQLGLKSEKILKTLDGRRVDFVKFDENGNVEYFVEIQGEQHTNPLHEWYEDSHAQDVAKRKWAKENNVLMIEIDMYISSWEYFKKQINKCEYLPSINEKDEKAILELMELNKRYPILHIKDLYLIGHKTTHEIAKIYNTTHVTINNILRRQNIELRDGTTRKLVRCVETGEIYQSTMDVQRELGINNSGVSACCNGKQKTAGSYHFEYIGEMETKAYHREQYYNENPTLEIELDDMYLEHIKNSKGEM